MMENTNLTSPGVLSARLRRNWAILACGFGVLLVALVARLAMLNRDTDSEEIRHLYIIMSSPTIRDVTRALAYQMQPAFDYLVRKIFWAPLIGQEEREARLVSVLYGLCAVALCYWAVVRHLRQIKVSDGLAALLGFLTALAIALNSSAILASTDARHYIFVMLLSMAWIPLYCLSNAFDSRRFRWLSFIFACTHFFALYLVAFACGLEVVKRFWRSRRIASVKYPMLLGPAVLIVTVVINRYAFNQLMHFNGPKRDLGVVLSETLKLFLRFWNSDLSLSWALVLACLLGPMAFVCKSERMLRAFLLAIPGMLLFLFFARHKSDYEWSDHYCYVFWGIVPVVAALTVEWVRSLASRMALPANVAAVGMLAILIPFVSFPALRAEASNLSSIRIPRRNFTSVYQLYAKMKAEHVPLFVLYPDAFSFEIPPYYFLYTSPPYMLGFQALDTVGGNGGEAKADIAQIAEWMKLNSTGLFYLDTRSGNCGVEGAPSVGSVQVRRIESGTRCDWRLENVHNVHELIAALRAVKFPVSPEFARGADLWAEGETKKTR